MQEPENSGTRTKAALVCFAVREEAAAFKRLAANSPGVEILITGMGKQNAERAVREFLSGSKPALMLSCGFAGGLNPKLAPGTVVFSTTGNPALEKELLSAGACPARFHCAERVAVSAVEKSALHESTGADAVEMESQAIGLVCGEHQIPFATVRVILDAAQEDLPLDFNRLMTPDLRMDYSKLAGELLKAPASVGALLRLQRQGKVAAETLAQVLAGIIPL